MGLFTDKPQNGMLPLMMGIGILQNNQARPYTQGPPTLGAGLAQGAQLYLQQQAAQQKAARQTERQKAEEDYRRQTLDLQRERSGFEKERLGMTKAEFGRGSIPQGHMLIDPFDPSKGMEKIPGLKEEFPGVQKLIERDDGSVVAVMKDLTTKTVMGPGSVKKASGWSQVGPGDQVGLPGSLIQIGPTGQIHIVRKGGDISEAQARDSKILGARAALKSLENVKGETLITYQPGYMSALALAQEKTSKEIEAEKNQQPLEEDPGLRKAIMEDWRSNAEAKALSEQGWMPAGWGLDSEGNRVLILQNPNLPPPGNVKGWRK